MDIRHVWEDTKLTLVISGDLSCRGSGEELQQGLKDADAERCTTLVVDLSKSFIPGSRFIAKFVEVASLMRSRGVKVHLRTSGNPSACESVRLFSIDRIVDVFEP